MRKMLIVVAVSQLLEIRLIKLYEAGFHRRGWVYVTVRMNLRSSDKASWLMFFFFCYLGIHLLRGLSWS